MNNNVLIRSVVALFIVYAAAAVSLAIFYTGDSLLIILPIGGTVAMLVPLLLSLKQSQDATATKVTTVENKVDKVQEQTNHRMDELLLAVKQLALAQGVAIGRQQMGEEPPTPAAPVHTDVDSRNY